MMRISPPLRSECDGDIIQVTNTSHLRYDSEEDCFVLEIDKDKACSFCPATKLENYYTGKTGRIACPECFKSRVESKFAKERK